MSWRLLVFDWDGTLMDSAAHIVSAVQAAADDVGLPVPEADAVRHVIGLSLQKAFASVLPGAGEAEYARFLAAYRRRFWQGSQHRQSLFPGAREVLASLKDAGYLLAVATGKGKAGLERAIRDENLLDVFDVTRCAEETLSKPHPKMLHEILEDLGLEPSAGLMIGDTTYDMEMAVNAGMERLAVTYGAHRRELLLPHQPLGFLDDIRELPAWLDEAVTGRAG